MQYEFLSTEPRIANLLQEWVEADAAGARLSWAFRTYYRLRPWVPLAVRHLLQRSRPVEVTPDWFLPREFRAQLATTIGELEAQPLIHPWPDGAQWSLVLTHDVESADGLRNVLRLADMEEEFGFRSAWNIVPYLYPVDWGIVRELRAHGFEIGVHGYNHDGRLFESQATFSRRAVAINRALEEFEAVGFRAPMVHRNLTWLQQLDVEYDASTFDVDPFQAMPGGVGSIWPFVVGRFVELPYTLPQDHTLLVVLKERDGRIWREKLDFLVANHGMALLVTHPDYLQSPVELDIYRRFLADAAERDVCWHALPRDVARWWRDRQASQLVADAAGNVSIEGPAAERGTTCTIGALCDAQPPANLCVPGKGERDFLPA